MNYTINATDLDTQVFTYHIANLTTDTQYCVNVKAKNRAGLSPDKLQCTPLITDIGRKYSTLVDAMAEWLERSPLIG